MIVRRLVTSILFVSLLVACVACGGDASPTETPVIIVETIPADTPVPGNTTAPEPTMPPSPTAAPTLAPTAQPVAPPVSMPGAQEMISRTYGVVVLLYGADIMMEEAAQQAQEGKLEGMKSLGPLIVVGVVLSSTGELLDQPPPSDQLQEAWQKGKAAHATLKSVVSGWWDKTIPDDGVAAALVPARAQIDEMAQAVEQFLVTEYGANVDQLHQLREEIVAQLRVSLHNAFGEQSDAAATPAAAVEDGSTGNSGDTESVSPESPEIEITSHTSYVDGDWFHIVGEVKNNTDTPKQFVKIVATLYDQNGKVVGTDFTYTQLDVIPPHGKAPFETGTDDFGAVDSYKLQLEGQDGELPRQDLQILSHESYEDGGWLHIRGEIKNNGSTEAQSVKVVATLYDAAGSVVGQDFAYTTLETIQPGTTSPFETGTDRYPGFATYEIQVEGR